MGWNQQIEISRLVPSALNPRQTMSGIEDLAESLQAHGLLQPLVVRRLPNDKPGKVRRAYILYQLQDAPETELTVHSTVERLKRGGHSCINEQARGALRHLERLGLIRCVTEVPMKAYKATQAGLRYDVAQVDNEEFEIVCGHRRHAAARVAGIQKLECKILSMSDEEALEAMLVENSAREDVPPLEESDALMKLLELGANLEDLRERMGRSAKWVRDRRALADLAEEGRALVARQVMTLGAAVALSKLPTERQVEIVKRMVVYPRVTLEVVQRAIRQRQLKHAPWDLADATLGGRGACNGCPMQSGAHADLWGKPGQGAACIDSTCWTAKFDALAARLEAEGRIADEAERVIHLDHRLFMQGHVDKCWRDYLGGMEPMYRVVESDLREVINVDDAIEHLRGAGHADLADALHERAYPQKVDGGPEQRPIPSTKSVKAALSNLVDAVAADPSIAERRAPAILAAVIATMGKAVSKVEKRRKVTLDEEYLDEIGAAGRMALLVELSVLQSIDDSRARDAGGLIDGDIWPELLEAHGIEVPAHTMAG